MPKDECTHLENDISLALTASMSLESYGYGSFEEDDYYSLRQLYSTESAETAQSSNDAATLSSSILSRQAASRIKRGRESHKLLVNDLLRAMNHINHTSPRRH